MEKRSQDPHLSNIDFIDSFSYIILPLWAVIALSGWYLLLLYLEDYGYLEMWNLGKSSLDCFDDKNFKRQSFSGIRIQE